MSRTGASRGCVECSCNTTRSNKKMFLLIFSSLLFVFIELIIRLDSSFLLFSHDDRLSLRLHRSLALSRHHHSVKVLIDHFDSLTTERTRSDNDTKDCQQHKKKTGGDFCYLPTMIKNRSLILRTKTDERGKRPSLWIERERERARRGMKTTTNCH